MKEEHIQVRPKTSRTKQILSTHNGHRLTVNESIFIDEYLKTGNATQSYLTAYPNGSKQNATYNGARVLRLDHIKDEINYRMQKLEEESIADAKEILRYFTSVMRGQIKDQFGLDAPLGERTKRAMELAKRQIDIANKVGANDVPELKITLDWSRE